MEEDRAAGFQKFAFPDESQFVVDRVPVVIAVDENAIELFGERGEDVVAQSLQNFDAAAVVMLGEEVCVETGIDDRHLD